jgi:uncharacterized membrane protein
MKTPIPASRLRIIAESLRPETIFLILSCSFGLAVLFANAPFQAPDENDHYFRAFQLSEGTLIGEKRGNDSGGELPAVVANVTQTDGIPFHNQRKMTQALFERLLHPAFVDWSRAQRVFHGFPHTVVYPPAGYLPQTLAILLGRMLRIGPLGLMYLARLGGLAASVALGFAALRALPAYRWTMLVVLLCPMSLYLFGSIASDGVLISGAALLMALLIRLEVRGDQPVGIGCQAALLALAGILALAKPVYMPLAGVALFIVFPRLGTPRAKALYSAATVIFCLLPVLVWIRLAAPLYVPADGDVPVDPAAQAHVIVGAPLAFLALVVRTVMEQYPNTYQWMVGTLGWGDTPLPGWFYAAFGYGIVGCLVLESGRAGGIRWRLRIVMAAAALVAVVLIYAAQYASWNPPGSREPIEGIEGRYFLPLLPLVVLCFPPVLPRSPGLLLAALATALATLGSATCLCAVILRYYVPSHPSSASGRTARLTSITTRAMVGTRENILITGFVVSGEGLETLLVRAEGPSLAGTGLPGALAHPSLCVRNSKGAVLASNTGWRTGTSPEQVSASSAAVGAAGFQPGSADSALVVSLPEGRYTVEVGGAGGATGVAQEGIYELSFSGTRLANVSSRSYVGRGANAMVVGFSVGGTGTEPLLGRAVGPSLRQFGVTAALARPTLDISPFHHGALVNAGWATSPAKADISAASQSVGAFPFLEDSVDSAAVVSLPPGRYTMRVYGADGTTGVALAEVYELP